MTVDEIATMPAGPAMDALIATKVFGYRAFVDEVGAHQFASGEVSEWAPPYSKTIAAAWLVVKHLTETTPTHEPFEVLRFGGGYRARFGWIHEGAADAAPLAICRAALLVVQP